MRSGLSMCAYYDHPVLDDNLTLDATGQYSRKRPAPTGQGHGRILLFIPLSNSVPCRLRTRFIMYGHNMVYE